MKRICMLLLLLLTTATVFAEFKCPAGVFRMAQLDEAMNQAAKQKKPLFFVYSDETHTDFQMPELLQDALKAGNNWSVTVFVSLKEEWSMPPTILSARRGGSLPMLFISTPESDKVFKVITPPTSPTQPQDMRKHVRAEIDACKPEIAAWFAAKPPHGPEMPGDRKLTWPQKGSHGSEEIFAKVKNEKLYFRGQEDEQVPGYGIPLADLMPATVRYLRYISGTGAAQKETEKPTLTLEKWTNAQGKILEAAFLSLNDGKVRLRTATGKEHTLALNTLSAESQKRARQLAEEGTKKD